MALDITANQSVGIETLSLVMHHVSGGPGSVILLIQRLGPYKYNHTKYIIRLHNLCGDLRFIVFTTTPKDLLLGNRNGKKPGAGTEFCWRRKWGNGVIVHEN